jgi:hypothetical protein
VLNIAGWRALLGRCPRFSCAQIEQLLDGRGWRQAGGEAAAAKQVGDGEEAMRQGEIDGFERKQQQLIHSEGKRGDDRGDPKGWVALQVNMAAVELAA